MWPPAVIYYFQILYFCDRRWPQLIITTTPHDRQRPKLNMVLYYQIIHGATIMYQQHCRGVAGIITKIFDVINIFLKFF